MNYLSLVDSLDTILILLMIFLIIVSYCKVKVIIKKFRDIFVKKEISGVEVANSILEARGKGELYVVETKDWYGSHYDPLRKSLRLASWVFNETNISSIGQAAVEAYICSSDKENLFWKIRKTILPYYRYGILGMYLLLLLGIIGRNWQFLELGIVLLGWNFVLGIISWVMLVKEKEKIINLLVDTKIIVDLEKELMENFLSSYCLVSISNILRYGIDFVSYWLQKLFNK